MTHFTGTRTNIRANGKQEKTFHSLRSRPEKLLFNVLLTTFDQQENVGAALVQIHRHIRMFRRARRYRQADSEVRIIFSLRKALKADQGKMRIPETRGCCFGCLSNREGSLIISVLGVVRSIFFHSSYF